MTEALKVSECAGFGFEGEVEAAEGGCAEEGAEKGSAEGFCGGGEGEDGLGGSEGSMAGVFGSGIARWWHGWYWWVDEFTYDVIGEV